MSGRTLDRASREYRRCLVVQQARDGYPAVIVLGGVRYTVARERAAVLELREPREGDYLPAWRAELEAAACGQVLYSHQSSD